MKAINVYPSVAGSLSLAATLTLAMLATSPAHAAVDTIYPGEQCVVSTVSAGQPTMSFYGSIGNPSSTNRGLFVDCPLAHEVSSTGIAFGIVAVISQSPTDYWGSNFGADCELFSLNITADGVYTGSWDWEYAKTVSASTQYLHFGSLPAGDHYYYGCQIPAKYNGKTSYVNAYRIYQN